LKELNKPESRNYISSTEQSEQTKPAFGHLEAQIKKSDEKLPPSLKLLRKPPASSIIRRHVLPVQTAKSVMHPFLQRSEDPLNKLKLTSTTSADCNMLVKPINLGFMNQHPLKQKPRRLKIKKSSSTLQNSQSFVEQSQGKQLKPQTIESADKNMNKRLSTPCFEMQDTGKES
jgi:hypothetical protein